MIVVGASDSYSTVKSGKSNYSTKYVDVAAPGTSIRSTIPGYNYGYKDGTSMATPHVAGIAASLRSAFPSAMASQISRHIQENLKFQEEQHPINGQRVAEHCRTV